MSYAEYNELTYLADQFKKKLEELKRREEEWAKWLRTMEAYMSKGLFKKKYRKNK